jgi:hypothetical protein
MPAILQQLMRHEDITTTLKYYVGSDAQATAEVLYAAYQPRSESLPATTRPPV